MFHVLPRQPYFFIPVHPLTNQNKMVVLRVMHTKGIKSLKNAMQVFTRILGSHKQKERVRTAIALLCGALMLVQVVKILLRPIVGKTYFLRIYLIPLDNIISGIARNGKNVISRLCRLAYIFLVVLFDVWFYKLVIGFKIEIVNSCDHGYSRLLGKKPVWRKIDMRLDPL